MYCSQLKLVQLSTVEKKRASKTINQQCFMACSGQDEPWGDRPRAEDNHSKTMNSATSKSGKPKKIVISDPNENSILKEIPPDHQVSILSLNYLFLLFQQNARGNALYFSFSKQNMMND